VVEGGIHPRVILYQLGHATRCAHDQVSLNAGRAHNLADLRVPRL
jgi:hypothetical protein